MSMDSAIKEMMIAAANSYINQIERALNRSLILPGYIEFERQPIEKAIEKLMNMPESERLELARQYTRNGDVLECLKDDSGKVL